MSKNIGDVKVNIELDPSGVKKGSAEAKKEVRGLKDDFKKGFEEMGSSISQINPAAGELVSKLQSVKSAGGALAMGFTALGAAAGAMALLAVETAKVAGEIEKLSALSGNSTAVFQEMAVGAKKYGIEQEDLADKLKDFRERVGEFTQTGGGPMKDFFDNIAPKVGVTADQFARLSGKDALLLYVSSLEKAGVSGEEMIWYLENMAGDLSKLYPLLKDNGAEMKAYGEYARKTGLILSDQMIDASKELNKEISQTGGYITGMANAIAGEAIPKLTGLLSMINSTIAGIRSLQENSNKPIINNSFVNGALGYVKRMNPLYNLGTLGGMGGSNPQTDNPTFDQTTPPSKPGKTDAERAAEEAKKKAEEEAKKAAEAAKKAAQANAKKTADDAKKAAEKAAADRAKTEIDKQNELIRLWDQYNGLTQTAKDQVEEYQAIAEGAGESEINLLKLRQKYENDLQAIRDNPKLNEELRQQLENRRAEVYAVEQLVEGERALAEINKSYRDQQAENKKTVYGLVGRNDQGETKDDQVKRNKALLKEAADNGQITAEELQKGNWELDKMAAGLEVLDGIASQAFGQMSDAIIDYAQTGKMNFRSLAADFTAMVAKMIIQALMLKAVNAALQSSGIPISIKSANGNVFGPGAGGARHIPFANGGVFASPITFPMAGGRTGLMGEAGPEAVMPLTRIGGKLGVKAVGVGGANQTQVINNVSVTVNGGNTNDQTGQVVADAVIRAIAKDQIYQETRHGGILSR